MPICPCADCGLHFHQMNKRSLWCRGCKELRRARQQLENQRKNRHAQRVNDPFDIPECEIERRYQAALKASRRVSTEGLEPFRSYGWLYREPRS